MAFDITSYILGKKSAGGGGSSDFTTATVTISTSAGESILLVPNANEASPPFEPNPYIKPNYYLYSDDGAKDLTVVLYKGYADFYVYSDGQSISNVTGDITLKNSTYATITGDCTITIS